MNTVSNVSQRRSPAPNQSQPPVYDAGPLAYEDLVALATRLSKKGYTELGADFLAFANSPTGLASLHGVRAKSWKVRESSAALQDTAAALPYLAAATILLKSKNLRRIEVGKAELLIELGKANTKITEEEPPMFMD